MAILEVKNLQKRFGDLMVLKGVDFSLEKGQTMAVIGASGGGKTTLLRCLNFLEIPTKGQILVNGNIIFDADDERTLTEKEIRQNRLNFGLVFQNFNLFPQYTALENVSLAPGLCRNTLSIPGTASTTEYDVELLSSLISPPAPYELTMDLIRSPK